MEVKHKILKQARISVDNSPEEFAKRVKLSEYYIGRLEAGEVHNLEYIYDKYAAALSIPVGRIKKTIADAEREKWDDAKIAIEVKKMVTVTYY